MKSDWKALKLLTALAAFSLVAMPAEPATAPDVFPVTIRVDAAKTKEHHPDVRVLIFATPEKVSEHKKGLWAKKIAEEFGLLLR